MLIFVRRKLWIMFDVTKIEDVTEGGVRKTAFRTCGFTCSVEIDIETEDEVIRITEANARELFGLADI